MASEPVRPVFMRLILRLQRICNFLDGLMGTISPSTDFRCVYFCFCITCPLCSYCPTQGAFCLLSGFTGSVQIPQALCGDLEFYNAIGADNFRCWNIYVPVGTLYNRIPLTNRSLKDDTGQAGAVIEGAVANGGHTVRNGDAGQAGAAREGKVTNAGYTVRNGDAGQAGAVREDILTNGGDAVRNGDAGQAGAAIEGTIANAGHTVWNRDASQAFAHREGKATNAGHAIRDGDARQTVAVIEGKVTNAGNSTIGRDCTILTSNNESFTCRFNDAIALTMINWIARFNYNTTQIIASREGGAINAGHALRDGDARQTVAFTESSDANAGYAVRDGDTGQADAEIEGTIANAGNRQAVIGTRYHDVSIRAATKTRDRVSAIDIECKLQTLTRCLFRECPRGTAAWRLCRRRSRRQCVGGRVLIAVSISSTRRYSCSSA